MKIEGDKIDIHTPTTDRPGRPAATPGGVTGQAAPAAQGDQLQLSPDAHIVKAAVESANQLPPVREELVERMRALLAKGDLGGDATHLADAVIDRWLEDA